LQDPTTAIFILRRRGVGSAALLSHALASPMLQLSRLKVLIRLGQSLFLGSGKATTRAKGRITAALRVLGLLTASPRGHFGRNSTAPLKLAEA